MDNNYTYWYDRQGVSTMTADLPPRALPKSKKNKAWKKSMMDALERVAIRQVRNNLKYRNYYRMIDGKMSYIEAAEIMPQLTELSEMLSDTDIPTNLKHYDILGIIINGLVGEYIQNTDKFVCTETGEIATNEYLRTQTELLQKYVGETWEKELKIRMIQNGINPDPQNLDMNDQEAVQQYQQQLESFRQAKTPPEIDKYMKTTWKTAGVQWAQHTLEQDKERFYLDELDRQNLIDFLLTGKAFRHFRVGYDSYEPERWNPITTFHSENFDMKYPQTGDFIGRLHFYTGSELLNKYGSYLTKEQKERIINPTAYANSVGYHGQNDSPDTTKILKGGLSEPNFVPFENYYDYNHVLSLQDEYGIPLAERTYIGADGSENTVNVFLPGHFNGTNISNSGRNLAQAISENTSLRGDIYQTIESYFVTYYKIAYITYITDSGQMTTDIVTEDILPEFLKENEIKTLKNKTLKEVEENPEPNTIVWDYAIEVYQGTKISNVGNSLVEDIYLNVEPLDYQIKGNSNMFDILLPVAGIKSNSIADKLNVFQVGHNIAMNQLYSFLEKEIGLFWLYDINFLPSSFKEWGDSEEMLLNLKSVIQNTGLMPIDSSKQNTGSASGFSQFAPQNLTYTAQIQDRMQLSEFFKNLAFEQVGFTPQRRGTPVKQETAEGVKTSQNNSFMQTEIYFEEFSGFKKRALEMHLTIAQYSQKNFIDSTSIFTKSDTSLAFLKQSDPDFPLRNLGILPISNAKKRKELSEYKAYLMNTNTLGADEYAIAKLFTSDSMIDLMESARIERINRQEQEEVAHQREMESMQAQEQILEERENRKFEREEASKDKDRYVKLQEAKIEMLARASDKDTDDSELAYITKQADSELKRQMHDDTMSLKISSEESKNQKAQDELRLKWEKLKQDTERLNLDREKLANDRYIAEINKN